MELQMDSSRFTTIWEYAITSDSVTQEDVQRACEMYLGEASANQDALKSSIAALLSAVGNSNSNVLKAIVDGKFELTNLLATTLASKAEKPKQSVLRTILDDDLGNEEDDSSVEGGEVVGKKRGMSLLMRGFLKVKEKKLEWAGNWAMNTEAFNAGEKAKFRYELRGEFAGVDGEGKIESLPASCTFDGSFLVKDDSAPNGYNRMDENAVKMEFTPKENKKWTVTGKGVNQIAEFILEGEVEGESRRMAVIKTYMHDPADQSSEESVSNNEEIEEEDIDPTELADLQADQRETFGEVLGGSDLPKSRSEAKPKKRRLVEEEDD